MDGILGAELISKRIDVGTCAKVAGEEYAKLLGEPKSKAVKILARQIQHLLDTIDVGERINIPLLSRTPSHRLKKLSEREFVIGPITRRSALG
jgi:hypothetical protein